MGVNRVARLVTHGAPRIPNHQLVVVADASEEGLVKQMPGHVFHNGSVSGEDGLSVDDLVLLKWLIMINPRQPKLDE